MNTTSEHTAEDDRHEALLRYAAGLIGWDDVPKVMPPGEPTA